MSDNFKKQWERMNKHGKKKYIWIYCVLLYGIGAPFISMVYNLITGGYKSAKDLVVKLTAQIIFFSIAAYLAGKISWSSTENKILIEERKENLKNVQINFCYFCGSKLNDNSKTCPSCGKELDL